MTAVTPAQAAEAAEKRRREEAEAMWRKVKAGKKVYDLACTGDVDELRILLAVVGCGASSFLAVVGQLHVLLAVVGLVLQSILLRAGARTRIVPRLSFDLAVRKDRRAGSAGVDRRYPRQRGSSA